MKKKCLFLGLLMLLTVSCVVDRLNNVLSNGVDNMATPSWDVKFDVPIGEVKAQLSKIGEVKSMLEGLKFTDDEKVNNKEDALIHVKINEMTLDSSLFEVVDEGVSNAIGSDSVLTWPLPVGKAETPKTDDTSIPVIKLDLDSDDRQDLMLSSLKSNDGSLKIKVKMELQDLKGNWSDATKDDFFDEEGKPYIAIEDVQVGEEKYAIQIGDKYFSFKPGVYDASSGALVFETADFLNDYNNPIQPLGAWLWDATNDGWIYEEDGETHKLSTTEFEYRVSIPPEALQIRGKSFDIVEKILSKKDKEEAKKSVRSRSISRSGSELTPEQIANIKGRVESANGVKDLEKLFTEDGVTLEEVADAYNGDLNKVLEDSNCKIGDIMKSEVIIASDENIKVLGDEENGFGKYELEGTKLSAIGDAGNLKSLADFCKFHGKNAIQAIKFTFEVEVDLGEGFLITAEVIDDYEMAVDVDSSLPFSMIGKVLENASLDTYITHNFGCEMKIKEPKIANTTVKIAGLGKVGDDGFYLIPKDSCHMQLVLDEMPKEDGGMAFSMLVPKDTKVDIALNPTEENDLWIKMVLGANGTLKFDMNNFTGMKGGE